jgi:hypothetical protein
LLKGDRLVELHLDEAIVENHRDVRHRWQRKPIEPWRVLAWELVP